MSRKIEIAIPKPCDEKWSEFTPTAQGGFCGSCQKEVIDFTSWSEERLKAYFKNPSANTCGRFQEQQLKVYTYEQKRASVAQWLSVALTGLILIASREGSAQTVKPKTVVEQHQPEVKVSEVIAKHDSVISINGTVTSASDSSFAAGVRVMYNGKVKTTTDSVGRFDFTLPKTDSAKTIIFYSAEFGRARHVIRPGQLQKDISIVMGGIPKRIVVGGAISVCVIRRPWYSPKRWWHGVRGWFN